MSHNPDPMSRLTRIDRPDRRPSRTDMRPRALVGNAADEEQVAAAEETVELQKMSADDHAMAVYSTRSGRAEYWRILSHCGISHSTMHAVDMSNRIDPLAMAAAEGRRNVGLWMQDYLIRLSPDLYFTMHKEALENRPNG